MKVAISNLLLQIMHSIQTNQVSLHIAAWTLGSCISSYLHDVMHIDGFWLENNRWFKSWFLSARKLHDIHHQVINNRGLMHTNFGIGFFFFDRLFCTLR